MATFDAIDNYCTFCAVFDDVSGLLTEVEVFENQVHPIARVLLGPVGVLFQCEITILRGNSMGLWLRVECCMS